MNDSATLKRMLCEGFKDVLEGNISTDQAKAICGHADKLLKTHEQEHRYHGGHTFSLAECHATTNDEHEHTELEVVGKAAVA